MTTEKAILAGGCFWGMEELFRRQPGVVSTRVGYSGGDVPNATYRNHGTHAESIEVVYDPDKTDFRALLGPLSPREHGAGHHVSHVAGVVAFDVNETRPRPQCARRTVRASRGEPCATPHNDISHSRLHIADIEGDAG